MSNYLIYSYTSKSYKNPMPLKIWEYLWYDQKKEYFSNFWIKAKTSHTLCKGYQPFISIYTDYSNWKTIYVKFFGKQPQIFNDMEHALFYIKKQFDTTIINEYDYIIMENAK